MTTQPRNHVQYSPPESVREGGILFTCKTSTHTHTHTHIYKCWVINNCLLLCWTLREKEGKKNSVLMAWYTSPSLPQKWEFDSFADLGVSHRTKHFFFNFRVKPPNTQKWEFENLTNNQNYDATHGFNKSQSHSSINI